MQRSALCRSRRELSNAYLLTKIGVDTAENEPLEVWGENSIQYSLHALVGPRAAADGSQREPRAPRRLVPWRVRAPLRRILPILPFFSTWHLFFPRDMIGLRSGLSLKNLKGSNTLSAALNYLI